MTNVATDILDAVTTIDPNAPVVEVANAAIETAANPNPSTILDDLELAISLFKEFKSKIAGVHPSVYSLLKLML